MTSLPNTPARLVASALPPGQIASGIQGDGQRAFLISAIADLARDAGWTGQEIGLVRGKWGAKASVEQLQAIHDRLWDATAATIEDWDEPAAVGVLADEVWLWSIPLRSEPTHERACDLQAWRVNVAASEIRRAA